MAYLHLKLSDLIHCRRDSACLAHQLRPMNAVTGKTVTRGRGEILLVSDTGCNSMTGRCDWEPIVKGRI